MTDSKRESERQEQRNIHSESQSQPPSVNSACGRDLVDTFELFKNFLDHKLVNLKSDLISEQDSRSTKYREDSNIKFKSEGNRIQHSFNEEVLECLQKLYKQFLDTGRPSATIATGLISKLKDRNKLIRIADSSVGGWATVREYESSDIADNEEDEKRIKQAESRALRSIKEKTKTRPMPYTRPPTPARSDTAPNPAFAQLYQRNQPPFRQSLARREPLRLGFVPHMQTVRALEKRLSPQRQVSASQHSTQRNKQTMRLPRF